MSVGKTSTAAHIRDIVAVRLPEGWAMDWAMALNLHQISSGESRSRLKVRDSFKQSESVPLLDRLAVDDMGRAPRNFLRITGVGQDHLETTPVEDLIDRYP